MEWIASERGGKKLLLDGYIYVKKRSLAGGWVHYECELRRNRSECKAKIQVSSNNEFRERTEHNHLPDHGKANAHKLKNAMKRMAAETDHSPKQILLATMHEATEEGMMAMPGLENIKRSIRRQRQGSREAFAKYRMAAEMGLDGQGETLVAEPSVEQLGQNNTQGYIEEEGEQRRNMIKELEERKDQRLMGAGDGPVSLSKPQSRLGKVIGIIQKQRLQQQKTSIDLEANKSNADLKGVQDHISSEVCQQDPVPIPKSCNEHSHVNEAVCIERPSIDHKDLEGDRLPVPVGGDQIVRSSSRPNNMFNSLKVELQGCDRWNNGDTNEPTRSVSSVIVEQGFQCTSRTENIFSSVQMTLQDHDKWISESQQELKDERSVKAEQCPAFSQRSDGNLCCVKVEQDLGNSLIGGHQDMEGNTLTEMYDQALVSTQRPDIFSSLDFEQGSKCEWMSKDHRDPEEKIPGKLIECVPVKAEQDPDSNLCCLKVEQDCVDSLIGGHQDIIRKE